MGPRANIDNTLMSQVERFISNLCYMNNFVLILKAANVMRKGVDNCHNILDIVSTDMEPGDPDRVMKKTEITAMVQTMGGKALKQPNVVNHNQGGAEMPPGRTLFGADTGCLEYKVCVLLSMEWIL